MGDSGGGNTGPRRNRIFAEITADDLRNRNIMNVILEKIPEYRDGVSVTPKPLNIEDQVELIFDVMKVDLLSWCEFVYWKK